MNDAKRLTLAGIGSTLPTLVIFYLLGMYPGIGFAELLLMWALPMLVVANAFILARLLTRSRDRAWVPIFISILAVFMLLVRKTNLDVVDIRKFNIEFALVLVLLSTCTYFFFVVRARLFGATPKVK